MPRIFEFAPAGRSAAWQLDSTNDVILVCTPPVFISLASDHVVTNVGIDRWIMERGMALGCSHAQLVRMMERGYVAKETGRCVLITDSSKLSPAAFAFTLGSFFRPLHLLINSSFSTQSIRPCFRA